MKLSSTPFLVRGSVLLTTPLLTAEPDVQTKQSLDYYNTEIPKPRKVEEDTRLGIIRDDRPKSLKALASALAGRAEAYEKLERWAEAEKDWREALEDIDLANRHRMGEAAPLGYYLSGLGRVQYKSRQYSQSLASFQKASQERDWAPTRQFDLPVMMRANLHLENYAVALHNGDDALAALAETRRKLNQPEYFQGTEVTVLRLQSISHYLTGNLDAANEKWRQAAVLEKKDPANTLLDPGQAPLNQRVAVNPNDAEARLARARYFLDRGRNQTAPPSISSDFLDRIINSRWHSATTSQKPCTYQYRRSGKSH